MEEFIVDVINLKRETEPLLIAAQDKAKKCRLCEDRDETVKHMISECSKLVEKENNTRHSG